MNWLDWVLILIIIFSAIKGLRIGLFAGFARVIGLILGITVAFKGYRILAAYLDRQWGWGDSITELLVNHFSSLLNDVTNNVYINKLQENIPHYKNQLISEGINDIAHQVSITVLEFLSFILIFILVALVVKIAMSFFSSAVAYTFLSPLDYFGGLILGLVRGVIIVLVIALLLEPVLATVANTSQEQAGFISYAVKGSLLVPYALQLLNILNLHLSI